MFTFTGHVLLPHIRQLLTHTNTHNRYGFTALFLGRSWWDGARKELLDFMQQGKINRGRHTVRLSATPSGLISTHLQTPDNQIRQLLIQDIYTVPVMSVSNTFQTRNNKHPRAAAKPAACAKPLMLSTLWRKGKGRDSGRREGGRKGG